MSTEGRVIASTPAPVPLWRSVIRAAIIIVAVVLALLLLTRIPKTVEVFIVAVLIAYGVNPLIRRLSQRVPRLVAIAIVYGVFLLALLVGAVLVIPTTVEQIQNLFAHSSDYLNSAQTFVNKAQAWLNARFGGRHMLPPQLGDLENEVLNRISTMVQAAFAGAGLLLYWVITYVVVGITAIILSYYLLVNSSAIRQTFLSLFPDRSRPRAQAFAQEVARAFGGFIGGQLVLSAFSGVFTYIALLFISDYALLLGVLTGLLYAIPYLGVFAAILIGVLLGLLQSWKTALWTAIIIFVVTKIADTILVPKVMSESVGVSPIAIIFAVFAGGELFGLWGLILAIPAAALFKVVWNVWLHPWITGRVPGYEQVSVPGAAAQAAIPSEIEPSKSAAR